MSDDIAIKVENLTKIYKLYDSPKDRLKESLHPLRRKYHHDFYALNDVSFEVKKGETVGIIGRNGSGKSTLLKLITGVLTPSSGSVTVNGRVSALLELGAGFNPELSGLENVYFNGTLMGYTREEMDAKVDDILSFADIGEFVHQPVKTYSSGMFVRLAFAVAVSVEPEILIVDEALSVGDFNFGQKCTRKINEISRNSTVIFVSHSMRDIMMHCSKTVVINKGTQLYYGSSDLAIDLYMKINKEDAANKKTYEKENNTSGNNNNIMGSPIYGPEIDINDKITNISHKWVDNEGNPVKSIKHGSPLVLEFSFKVTRYVRNLVIGVPMWNSNEIMVTSINSDLHKIELTPSSEGYVRGKIIIDNAIFNPETYDTVFAVVDGAEFLYRKYIGSFTVEEMIPHHGFVTPVHHWCIDSEMLTHQVCDQYS